MLLGELSVQISLGCQANKWKEDVHPYGPHTLGQCLCASVFMIQLQKELETEPSTFQQLSRPKGTVHPYRTSSNANARQRFVNWTTLFPMFCSTVISAPLFYYHVTNTVSEWKRRTYSEWFPQTVLHSFGKNSFMSRFLYLQFFKRNPGSHQQCLL